MDATAIQEAEKPTDDLVILVHGTYAASNSDVGSSWWQEGSPAWTRLQARMFQGVKLASRGTVFHWSGKNSERSRSKAGHNLLERLLKLESIGRPYHLIGHSHGGSVIWHALREATLRREQLAGLRSWSTVGTPFLQHRTRSAWHFANIVNLLLAIALLRPALFTLRKLALLTVSALSGQDHAIVLNNGVPPALAAARGPLLRLLESLGVSVTSTADGIQLGSFDPAAGSSFFEYLFFSPEGWLIVGIALLCVYVYLNLATFFLSPVLESLRIRQEARLERKVMSTYQGRWLGLWSTEDEAINGLRTTLNLSISFVARMTYRESAFFSDRLSWISRPYHWVLIPLYNSLFRPLLDGLIRTHVVKTALGNNRPAAEVVAVSPVPTRVPELDRLPALPAWLNKKLTEAADHHACDIAPQLRCLLAEPSFASGLEKFSNTITGHELIHTSYFDHAEILDLLASHIAWSLGQRIRLPENDLAEPTLLQWFRDFKHQLGEQVSAEAIEGRDDSDELVTKRRQSWIKPRRRKAA